MADGEQQVLFEDTRRLHPKWGYDLDAVPRVLCLHCHTPIGSEEYVENTMLARCGWQLARTEQLWPSGIGGFGNTRLSRDRGEPGGH